MHNNKKHCTNLAFHIDPTWKTDRQASSVNDEHHGWREIKNTAHAKDTFPRNTGNIIVSPKNGCE